MPVPGGAADKVLLIPRSRPFSVALPSRGVRGDELASPANPSPLSTRPERLTMLTPIQQTAGTLSCDCTHSEDEFVNEDVQR